MTRRRPLLYALRAFEAAARHASFTRAGEELAITQSAVSRHIRTLEELFGCRLFERHGRQLRLTERHACCCPGCATASMRWNGPAPPCAPPCAPEGVALAATAPPPPEPGYRSSPVPGWMWTRWISSASLSTARCCWAAASSARNGKRQRCSPNGWYRSANPTRPWSPGPSNACVTGVAAPHAGSSRLATLAAADRAGDEVSLKGGQVFDTLELGIVAAARGYACPSATR